MAPTLMKIGFCQSVISRSSWILISRSSGPVQSGMAARAALVDAARQRAHLGDAIGDLVAEQHPSAAGLRALPDDDLDRVAAAQVVGVHAVARGQELVDEHVGVPALLGRHAAVAGGRRRADLARAAAERLLRLCRERAERHAGDRDRDLQVQRLLRVAGAEHDVGVAALAVALERIARHARAEHQQVVEVGEPALRAEAADVVDALARRALDLGDVVAVEELRLAQPRAASLRRPSVRVVDVEGVQLAGRAVAAELAGRDVGHAGLREQLARARRGARPAAPSRRSPHRARRPRRARRCAPRRASRRGRRRRRRARRGARPAP